MRSIFMLALVCLIAGCAQLPMAQVPEPPKPQALAVVFDIDNTLTPAVTAFSEVRPDATAAVRGYADKGYKIVYLSARIRFLQNGIPAWLKEQGFPEGNIHVAQTKADHNDPASFKIGIMEAYQSRGWRLVGGYGDSSTDFEAYAHVGIPKSAVFALQRRNESGCQPGQWQECLRGWSEHLAYISHRRD